MPNVFEQFNQFAAQALDKGMTAAEVNAERNRLFNKVVLPAMQKKGHKTAGELQEAARVWNTQTDSTLQSLGFLGSTGESGKDALERRDMTRRGRAGGLSLAAGAAGSAANDIGVGLKRGTLRALGFGARFANDLGENEKGTFLDNFANAMNEGATNELENVSQGYRDAMKGGVFGSGQGFGIAGLESLPNMLLPLGVGKVAASAVGALGANAGIQAGVGGLAALGTGFTQNYGAVREGADQAMRESITPEMLRVAEKSREMFGQFEQDGYKSGLTGQDLTDYAYNKTIDQLGEDKATDWGLIMTALEPIAMGASTILARSGGGKYLGQTVAERAMGIGAGNAAMRTAVQNEGKSGIRQALSLGSARADAGMVGRQALEESLQGGAEAYAGQDAAAELGGTPVDWGKVGTNAAAEGILGGIMGGGMQVASGNSPSRIAQQQLGQLRQQHQVQGGLFTQLAQDAKAAEMSGDTEQFSGLMQEANAQANAVRVVEKQMKDLGIPFESVLPQVDPTAQPTPQPDVQPTVDPMAEQQQGQAEPVDEQQAALDDAIARSMAGAGFGQQQPQQDPAQAQPEQTVQPAATVEPVADPFNDDLSAIGAEPPASGLTGIAQRAQQNASAPITPVVDTPVVAEPTPQDFTPLQATPQDTQDSDFVSQYVANGLAGDDAANQALLREKAIQGVTGDALLSATRKARRELKKAQQVTTQAAPQVTENAAPDMQDQAIQAPPSQQPEPVMPPANNGKVELTENGQSVTIQPTGLVQSEPAQPPVNLPVRERKAKVEPVAVQTEIEQPVGIETQPNDIGRASDGLPFASERAAKVKAKADGLTDSHEVVSVGASAFVIRPKATEPEQSPTKTEQPIAPDSEYAKYLANPMLKSRMDKSLDQRYSVDGKAITGRKLLTDKVNDGWAIDQVEEIDHKKNKKLREELDQLLASRGGLMVQDGKRRSELESMVVKGGGRFQEVLTKPILKDPNDNSQIELNKFELAFVEHLISGRSATQENTDERIRDDANRPEPLADALAEEVQGATEVGQGRSEPDQDGVNEQPANEDPVAADSAELRQPESQTQADGDVPAVIETDSVNPFAQQDEIAKLYGYSVTPDGDILKSNGSKTAVSIKIAKGRLRVSGQDGGLLFTGKTDSIGKFLEDYWYAKKTSEAKPKPRMENSSVARATTEVISDSGLIHNIPNKLMDTSHKLGDVAQDLAAMTTTGVQSDHEYAKKLLQTIANLNPDVQVHVVSDLNNIQDKAIRANLLAGGFYVPEQNTVFVYPKSEDWVGSALELVNHELVHSVTEQSITDGLVSKKDLGKLQDLRDKINDFRLLNHEELSENLKDRFAYILGKNPDHETLASGIAESEVRQALNRIVGADGLQQLDAIFTDISTAQVKQNGTRNKGGSTRDGEKAVLGDLPKTDEGSAAAVPELSSKSTGSQDANGGARSGQASLLAAERESSEVTKLPSSAEPLADNRDVLRSVAVWHGSPYQFERFSLEHLGKGEGAQVYGWGLYFAGDRAVAEHYKKVLSSMAYNLDSNRGLDRAQVLRIAKAIYPDSLDAFKAETIASNIVDALEDGVPLSDVAMAYKNNPEALAAHNDLASRITAGDKGGKLYRVRLSPNESDFLSLDQPLSEQKQHLDRLKPILDSLSGYDDLYLYENKFGQIEGWTGSDLISALYEAAMDDRLPYDDSKVDDALSEGDFSKAVSMYLHSLGIAGNRYLSNGGTGGGKGHQNYVLFDDSAAEIIEAYNSKDTQQQRPANAGQTVEQVRNLLTERFGADVIAKLENSGKLEIVQSIDNLPQDALNSVMAWHGSPYNFTKFSLDHLSKGAGGQLYGYGLYFSNDRAVADFYRERLSASKGTGDGKLYQVEMKPDDADFIAWDGLLSQQPKHLKALQPLRDSLAKAGLLKQYEDALMNSFDNFIGGELYTVTKLAAQNGILPKQSGEVQQAVNAGEFDKAASLYLRSIGVAGIKYQDIQETMSKRDAFNYVLFDSAAVDIVETYYSQNSNGIEGFYNPTTDKTTLVADNLTPRTVIPTLLHEMGGHAGFQTVMRPETYAVIMQQFDKMVEAGNPLAVKAKQRAERAESDPAIQRDEYLPYLITEASIAQDKKGGAYQAVMRLIGRAVAAVRAWAFDKLGVRLKLNPNDIVALAERMVKQAANPKGKPPTPPKGRSNADTPDQGQSDIGWMKAPNGKPTNLTERQWLQVRTPEFKAWFGDWESDPANASKVVDANGEPMVVYHGTNAAFNEFKPSAEGAIGAGVYMAASADEAILYGRNAMQVFANVRSPVRDTLQKIRKMQGATETAVQWSDRMKRDGNDGVIAESFNKEAEFFVAFNPTQVKSATDNTGNFDGSNPDIRFSRRDTEFEDAPVTPTNFTDRMKRRLREDISQGYPAHRASEFIRRWLGTPLHLSLTEPQFKPVFTLIQERLNHVSAEASHAIEVAPEILGRRETFADFAAEVKNAGSMIMQGKYTQDMQAAAKVLFDGTLIAKKVFTDEELTSKGLTADQVKRYREMRAAINTSLDQSAKAHMSKVAMFEEVLTGEEIHRLHDQDLSVFKHRDQIEAKVNAALKALDPKKQEDKQQIKRLNEARKKIGDIDNRLGQLKEEGYAPLMRFGQHDLRVVDSATGDTVLYEMFETKRERDRARDSLIEANLLGDKYEMTTKTKNPEEYKLFREQGINPETFALFSRVAGLDSDQAYQAYLKLATAPQSAMRRLIHRKGIAGFSENTDRVMAAFVISNARRSANMLYSQDIESAVMQIDDGELQGYAQKLVAYINDPVEEMAGLRSFLFFMNMGFSLRYGLLNLTQPYIQTLPELTRYVPAGRATKIVTTSSGTALKSMSDDGAIPAEFQKDYQMLKRKGFLEPQNIWALQGRERGRSATTSAWDVVLHSSGIIAQFTETVNRRTAMIAALRTAKIMGADKLKAEGFDSAYDFAAHVIQSTQGVMNKGNRPQAARGLVGAPLFVFRTFSIQYVEQMIRMIKNPQYAGERDELRKALLLLMLMLFGLAGATGLPFAKDLLDIFETGMSLSGNPVNFEREVQQVFGKEMAEPILYGAVNGFVFDMHGSTSMGDLLPATRMFHPDTSAARGLLEIGGATGGFLNKMGDSGALMMQGKPADGVVNALPRFATSIGQGTQIATTGEFRTQYGNKLTDGTSMDAVLKMLDMNPSGLAQQGRIRMLEREDLAIRNAAQQKFRNQLIEAYEDGNQAKIREIRADIADWNKDNPQYPVKIDYNRSIKPAIKRRSETWQERTNVPDGMEWMQDLRPD